MKPSK